MGVMEEATPEYDFFIAHAGPDSKAAERLFDMLEGSSTPFLDSRRLKYGDDWDRELSLAQRQSRISVVLVSSRTDTAFYEREEIAAAIAMARRDADKHRVVPVYLDSAAEEPYGLRLKHGMRVTREFPLASVARDLLKLRDRLHALAHEEQAPKKIDYARSLQFDEKLTVGGDEENGEELFAVAFSPGGDIAAGSNEKILLWDRARPTDPRIFEHDSYVYSVAFSHDGKWLAAGGEDGTVRVYSVDNGSLRWPPNRHSEAVYSVAFGPDGSQVASGGYDRKVKVWDARNGRRAGELARQGRVASVAFSPTEPRLLAIGDLNDTVTLWNDPDVHELKGHASSVETVAFSPDGRLVASAGLDKLVRVWDVHKRRLKWIGRGHEYLIRSVSFSPDGETVASASWDKTVRLWDAESGMGKLVLPWDDPDHPLDWHTDWIWSVAFSQNGMLVATGGSDGQVILLRVEEPN